MFVVCLAFQKRVRALHRIFSKLRPILAVFLTVALLFGPCLSLIGFAGTGSAHAHGQTSQATAHQDSAQLGHASAVTDQHSHAGKGLGHHGTPDKFPLNCEELCEGVAVKKIQRHCAIASLMEPDGDIQDTGSTLFGVGVAYSNAASGFRKPSSQSLQDDYPLSLRQYALTRRYRL